MAFKRPFGEESFDLPSKHPRQFDCSNEPTPFAEVADNVPHNGVSHEPLVSVPGAEGGFDKSECMEMVVDGVATDFACTDEDFEFNEPLSASSLSPVTSSASEEDSKVEAVGELSFYPVYFESEQHTRGLVENGQVYPFPLDLPPRRLVSIGTDHQADVPVWSGERIKSKFDGFDDNSLEQVMGTCIISMPSSEALISDSDTVGKGKTDCCCLDMGSIRCVRQHILEARESLSEILGREKFAQLGFDDTGEEVARNWNEEDEQVFHEVVLSNPASLGKNFWHHLTMVFPSRTKMELVSYYFNVFVLQRRAEQNRLDPLNIDSDNDEWQGNDDGYEVDSSEEDEDSVIQSPAEQDESAYANDFNEVDEDGEEIDDNDGKNNVVSSVVLDKGEKVACKQTRKPPSHCNPMLPNEHDHGCEEDNDFQDDSCTSYEFQPNKVETCGSAAVVATMTCHRRPESEQQRKQPSQGSVEGLSNVVSNHDYGIEPCDAVIWDVGYLSRPKGDVDLVPTCHMIKEVFGEEAWNSKERDGRASAGLS
ncbi:hypothetical protein Syun_021191 [Stephania yunnanensis]|uniref:ELM2 domain-containing protein n=1 Tax=Stephania yunnanensis TaxID=152371 RepID=A0AAP0IF82_9MAGN